MLEVLGAILRVRSVLNRREPSYIDGEFKKNYEERVEKNRATMKQRLEQSSSKKITEDADNCDSINVSDSNKAPVTGDLEINTDTSSLEESVKGNTQEKSESKNYDFRKVIWKFS